MAAAHNTGLITSSLNTMFITTTTHPCRIWLAPLALLVLAAISGCTAPAPLTLMPAPVLYHNAQIDPFAHLEEGHKTVNTQVFYATNRTRCCQEKGTAYGNQLDSVLHLGMASVRMGEGDFQWDDLYTASLSEKHHNPPLLSLEQTVELSTLPTKGLVSGTGITQDLQFFANAINTELDRAVDKEIVIYVHGTKVDFANSAILTAEVDHFAGRDFVGLAFAWPSHQNILSYLAGIDVQRALDSSSALQTLLVFLAEYTSAERINILSYSAGGKVTSKALLEMRQNFSELGPEELKKRFRLGSLVFAAADVDVDIFLERVTAISEMAQQVVVTVSDGDNALKAARSYMGGNFRAGSARAEKVEEAFILSQQLQNVEIIDVSIGHEQRGFDITGHHYWYRHPWMSSDIIFLLRTNLPPSRRGLSPTELDIVWYLSPQYPVRIRTAAQEELKGQW